MTFRAHHARTRLPPLDLTSMVDLVFLLVIFFLTTSTFIERNKARLQLPVDATAKREAVRPVDRAPVIVNVTRNGTIIVSREYVSLEHLVSRIRAELSALGGDASRLQVVVRADRDAPLRFVNQIAERLMGMGVDRWSLGMEIVRGEAEGGGS